MKPLKLYNYRYHRFPGDPDSYVITDIDLENLEDIEAICIMVITGDEVAKVLYTNGESKTFDSCNYRTMDFFDEYGCIYKKDKFNFIDEFLKRKDSYDFFHNMQKSEEE